MLSPDLSAEALAEIVNTLEPGRRPVRVNLNPERVEQGLAQLVLSVVELLRQLLERQAIRRVESGLLTASEIDCLGLTLMQLEEKMKALQAALQIDDLNIPLGPLGDLLEAEER